MAQHHRRPTLQIWRQLLHLLDDAAGIDVSALMPHSKEKMVFSRVPPRAAPVTINLVSIVIAVDGAALERTPRGVTMHG